MVIIRAEVLPKKEEIHNEIPLLTERVSPSSKIPIDNFKFHIKSRSCFGLLSSAYFIAQRFGSLELQINYLRCPYDI